MATIKHSDIDTLADILANLDAISDLCEVVSSELAVRSNDVTYTIHHDGEQWLVNITN